MTVILVVATIIFFLSVDWVVQRAKSRKSSLAAAEPQLVESGYPLRIPEGVFFAKSHTWLNLFPSGKVRLGVDDFVGSVLENPEISFMRTVGEKIEKGDPLLLLSEGDHQLMVRSPISGVVVSLNAELEKNPRVMREKLFSNGWAYTIQPQKAEDLRCFMIGEESQTWMGAEFHRLRDMLTGAAVPGSLAPAVLQDGGTPMPGALKQMDAAAWKKFENDFLQIQ